MSYATADGSLSAAEPCPDCDHEPEFSALQLSVICGRAEATTGSGRCDGCRGLRVLTGATIDSITRYEDDLAAQLFVWEHPDGADNQEIANLFGITRERVRQILDTALAKLRKRAAAFGIDPSDLDLFKGAA